MLRRGHKASRLSSETTQPQNAPKQRKWFPPFGAKQMQRDRRVESEEINIYIIYIYMYIYILLYYIIYFIIIINYHYVILIYFVIEIGWLRQRGLMIPDTVGTSLSTVKRTSDGMVSTLLDSLLKHAAACFNTKTETVQESWVYPDKENRLCARLGLTAAGRRSAQMHPVTRPESRNPDL